MKSLPEILGVPKGATLAEMKAAAEAKAQETHTPQSSEESLPTCRLCPNPTRDRYCHECSTKISVAGSYRGEHCVIPKRYAAAKFEGPCGLEVGKSYLLHGAAGTGKTHAAYALLGQTIREDPRLLIAAYSWTAVLMQLRRGYSNRDDHTGDAMIDALRKADLVLLDDLGAEKITDANSGWLREILFVILNDRWAEMRNTVITSNLKPEELALYVGDRIISRIVGMCEGKEICGADRRLS